RPARDPPRARAELPADPAALAARRRGLPRPRGCDCAQRDVAGGAADRRRHGLLWCALLRRRAAHEQELHVSAIALRSVSVTLGGKQVVDDVGLEVGSGEWVTLIGPNGAGKSTLLRAIAGLVPFDGAIMLDGEPLERLRRRD